jgi:hypothetical protein
MKNMKGFKHFVICVNDILGLLAFVSLVFISSLVIPFIGTLGAGIAVCIITGFWFVLSGVYTNGQLLIEEQQANNELLKELVQLQTKSYNAQIAEDDLKWEI